MIETQVGRLEVQGAATGVTFTVWVSAKDAKMACNDEGMAEDVCQRIAQDLATEAYRFFQSPDGQDEVRKL